MIAGPSGVGKGSIVRELLDQDPQLVRSVSATTRPPRPAEVDGQDYHFVTLAAFQRLIADEAMLESAEVFDNRYGTPAEPVAASRSMGRDTILEIDVQGAKQIRDRVPDAVLIFIEPPSLDELARRLRGRGTESPERIARRLRTAGWELDQRADFDHVVVNDDLLRASSQVAAIIDASRSDPEEPSS